MPENTYLLEVKDMSKRFGITVALDQVSFQVKPGEIRGLIGENGSGKSTVSSIIAGMQNADSGTMTYKGEPWNPKSSLDAQSRGIGMIVQEAGTIPNILVAENIFLGHEKKFAKGFLIDKGKMIAAAQQLLDRLHITSVRADMPTGRYNMQDRKLIEVAKTFYWEPSVFIVDETTTTLSHDGRQLLYGLMHDLTREGKSVLFISHDLEELMEQCDTLTVLRDGKIIGDLEKDEFEAGKIKKMMVGREVSGDYYHNDLDGYSDEVVLKADAITTRHELMNFTLELHKGEILGIGGLSHCGMHTVGRALFGAEDLLDGQVLVKGKPIKNTKQAIRMGVGYTSKDRDNESLCLQSPIRDNIASTGYRKNRSFGPLISAKKEDAYVQKQVDALEIKCASIYHNVSTLSGGNKQKVVFGKWLAADSDILILDCPTRGIDIGVKANMYKLIYDMKKQGKAIVFISEELPELVGMSDRILIMKDGEVSLEIRRPEGFSEHKLIEYMI